MAASQRTNVLPQKLIKQIWYYKEGSLYWITSRPGVQTQKPAGCLNTNGYIRIGYQYKIYAAHNLIWILFNGSIPDGYEVDHIDNNRSNNCIDNLRLLTTKENLSLRKHLLKPKGCVYYQKQIKRWRAMVQFQGVKHRLGCFKTEKEASVVLSNYLTKLQNAGTAAPTVDTSASPA